MKSVLNLFDKFWFCKHSVNAAQENYNKLERHLSKRSTRLGTDTRNFLLSGLAKKPKLETFYCYYSVPEGARVKVPPLLIVIICVFCVLNFLLDYKA